MSQLIAILSEARNTADETSPDKQDFIQVRNKRKRSRNYPKTNSEPIRPIIATIKQKTTQVEFASSMKNKLPRLNIHCIRKLSSENGFYIKPEDQISNKEKV